jgi:hypothetical protein
VFNAPGKVAISTPMTATVVDAMLYIAQTGAWRHFPAPFGRGREP